MGRMTEDWLINSWRKKMWKAFENSIKHLSKPYVAFAVVAIFPWGVIAFLAWLYLGRTGF